MEFSPTYLYIKQHAITGMLYFGKTTQKDPYKYTGSGLYWKSHIKKHGVKFVVTLWCELFTDEFEMTEFAKEFSKKMNIIESNSWANLVEETGVGGGLTGRPHSEETRRKISISGTGWKHTTETKQRLSELAKGRTYSSEDRARMSLSRKGKVKSEETKLKMRNGTVAKIVCSCIVCKTVTTIPHLSRNHKHH